MTRLARQIDYDHMVNELVTQQGASWEDAIQEVDETFSEGGYDLNSLFRYRNEEEFKQKTKTEGYLRMFEQLAAGFDASVNVIFGIQGLTQCIQSRGKEVIRTGTLRLVEQKKSFDTLIRVLGALSAESTENEDSNGEESDEEDDEDENKLLQKQNILNFIAILAQCPREDFLDYENFFCLSEETVAIFKAALDADGGEARYVAQLLLID